MVALVWVNTLFHVFLPSAARASSFASVLFYLFVGLGEDRAHALHRQAAVAQRTGLAAVPRRRVDALHSREAGVKLALRRGGRATRAR